MFLRRIFSYCYQQNTKMLRLIILGVFVHFILFVGIMDIYFSSPVQHGLPSYSTNVSLCKRVVVFVSDGLRAEGIFGGNNSKYTPFLTSIKDTIGSWGVAHTHVPTESRPGHVAIFAGMYEDPHAIMAGWKYNPIDFDHVFNQSKASFLWGSPDVIPMFNKDHLNKIYMEYYEPSFEDFSGQQSTILLDDWVFQKVKNYFQMNYTELHDEKSIIFLHLLGMDTAGHVYKPNSKKYFDNLMFVDNGIKDIVKTMDSFFNDNQTTYIFTSDHGMTDWGSHGSGTAHETEAPFMIWGTKVKQNPIRQDLQQADITTIISILLGINIPINSVGVFQENYFDITDQEVARILLTNTLMLGEQYKVQQNQMERNFISFFYKGFDELLDFDNTADVIRVKIKSGLYKEAISDLKHLITLIERGKFYNAQYLRVPMLWCLAIGLGIFMIYTMSMVLDVPKEVKSRHYGTEDRLTNVCFKIIISIAGIVIVLLHQNVEFRYCLYVSFPFIMVLCLVYDVNQIHYLIHLIFDVKLKYIGLYTIIVTCVYSLSLTFFNREYIFYIAVGVLMWMFLGNMSHVIFIDKVIWLSIILYLPTFYTKLSVFKENNPIISTMGAVIMMYISLTIVLNGIPKLNVYRTEVNYLHIFVAAVQFLCLFFSCANIILTSYYNEISGALMGYVYISSWTIFVLCFMTMTLHPRKILFRSIGIQVSLYNIYFLMSFNGEGLFLALFICLCLTWCSLEMRKLELQEIVTSSNFGENNCFLNTMVCNDDFRRCFVFLTFTLMSFFGAGNISDLNTFDPMWTRCFVKVFNPLLISALIIFKLVIPFFITTVTFQSINVFGKISTISSFSIILLYSDIMVMNMMFHVTNEGSWLEIGLSISRFVITNVITIALLIIYTATKFLTENHLFDILSFHFHRFLGIIVRDEGAYDELLNIAENSREE